MEYLPGNCLFDHMKNLSRFPISIESITKFYVAQVALAVGFLHQNHIIYRDLKLENILLQSNGYLKIADFGMAHRFTPDEINSNNCRTKEPNCGTIDYKAPEMIVNHSYSYAVDWWALGVLTYELIRCGFGPFYSRDISTMKMNIVSKEVAFPDSVQVSDDCKAFIKQLLQK